MNVSLNLFQLIFLLGAVHGGLNALALLCRINRSSKQLLFGLFILSLAMACFKTAGQEVFPAFWRQLPIPFLFQFAWGPLLLLYTRSTLYRGFRLQRTHLLLFVPSLVFDVLFVAMSRNVGIDPELRSDLSLLIDLIAAVHFSYYIFRSITTLRRYKQGLDGFYSNISAETIGWLVSLYIISGVMLGGWLFYMISTLWLWSYNLPFADMKTYYPGYVWICVAIYYLIQRWYQSPSVQRIDEAVVRVKSNKQPVYDPAEVLREVRANKYYQDPKLTIKGLAHRMQRNVNDLSQTINAGLNRPFNDFINELRVEEVQRKMQDPKFAHLNQLGIALESGFNSKATFNRAFKKFAGMNPSEYQKKLKKKKSQMPI